MKVFLSPLAEKKIEDLLNYLEAEWSPKSRNNFLLKVKQSVKQIAEQPKSCIESKEFKGLFKYVVSKQTSFYYRILKDEIEIITLIDNRQDPKEIEKEIKKYFGNFG
jgi:plasmid stabilization system protein ParE